MIETKNLLFMYDDKIILEDINLKLVNGHIYGLIGLNGSGKTTLLNCLHGFYYPNKGEVLVDGQNINKANNYYRENILLNDSSLSGNYNIDKLIISLAKQRSIEYDSELFNKLINIFNMNPRQYLKDLSKGNLKIALICVNLCLKPKYIFIDEYLDGIDVLRRKWLKNILIEYVRDNDALLVLTSHVVDDIKDICDEIILIKDSKLKYSSSLDQLRLKYEMYQVVSDSLIDKATFIDTNLQVIEVNNLNNVYWITVMYNEDNIELLKQFNYIDVRKVDISLKEVLSSEYKY